MNVNRTSSPLNTADHAVLQAAAPAVRQECELALFHRAPKCCGLGRQMGFGAALLARLGRPARVNRGRTRARNLWRRFSALVCLFAGFAGSLGVGPELLALAAWMEGSHSVLIRQGSEQVSLVLRHARQTSDASSDVTKQLSELDHRHGLASQFLCLLSSSSKDMDADHVACFAGASGLEQRNLKESSIKLSKPAAHSPPLSARFHSAIDLLSQESALQKPPLLSTVVLATRTTVLII